MGAAIVGPRPGDHEDPDLIAEQVGRPAKEVAGILLDEAIRRKRGIRPVPADHRPGSPRAETGRAMCGTVGLNDITPRAAPLSFPGERGRLSKGLPKMFAHLRSCTHRSTSYATADQYCRRSAPLGTLDCHDVGRSPWLGARVAEVVK